MRVQSATHWLPKRGNTLKEYEDAFYPKSVSEGLSQCSRFAVSDGASESMLSGPWAEVLVKSFCRSEVPVSRAFAKAIVGRACMAHEAWMKGYLKRREREGRPVQWYEEPGLEAGAFATLLGLSLLTAPRDSRDAGGKWEAVALGDSCLFQVRGNDLVTSLPIKQSSEFSQRPLLISSNPAKNRLVASSMKVVSGSWRRGDRFYLMTDALSSWFLRERERGKTPWLILDRVGFASGPDFAGRDLAGQEAETGLTFEALVERLRADGLMRNDDVTMTRIRVV